jgi:RNA polymerase sigma factor (sigma-70 family)
MPLLLIPVCVPPILTDARAAAMSKRSLVRVRRKRYVIVTAMLADESWLETERPRLVRLCAAISHDREAAEDLAQETLLEAWRQRHKLHDPAGADRWLNAIARNVCLRWSRRRARDAVALADSGAVPHEPVAEGLERDELGDLLERGLALLPPPTREMLVRHVVDGVPYAEIAARHGISEDAVSMRISRGRARLRALADADVGGEPTDGWFDTRLWCANCGRHRLQMRRDAEAIVFRCNACAPDASAVYPLDNPSYARVVGGRVRPTAILNRVAAWSREYFGGGVGEVACTRCGRPIRLRHHCDRRRRGLHGACGGCGEQVWSSVVGLAHSRPEVHAFRVRHGRVRTLPERELDYGGVDATLVRLEAVRGSAALDVVFARETLRVVAAH